MDNAQRQALANSQRWVIKIGSALLTDDGQGLAVEALDDWVAQIAALRQAGKEVVLVSSGAVAEGMTRLGWSERPQEVHRLQAAAAVGQMGLIQAYEARFQRFGLHTAQILLGHDDISARDRYLNARGALQTLLDMGVVPIVNENDTVVTEEIRFGDNDTLAALVANLLDADALMILTDQDGLYSADPRKDSSAELISHAAANDLALDAMAGGSAGNLGRGGMATKLRAARLAARSGASTVIVGGRLPEVIRRVAAGESCGTLLTPLEQPLAARKKWLAGRRSCGELQLDAGAVKVLLEKGKSLLPVGVKRVQGDFQRGDVVSCVDTTGNELARGLVNYSAEDARRIAGHSSDELASLVDIRGEDELIHRDNLVLLR